MTTTNTNKFLAGGGEMGALMRAKDWTQTSMGAPNTWPQSLQTILAVILHSKFPMFVWWGPELICFYNDAYRPSLGKDGKHPGILGIPAQLAWPEIWSIIQPLIEQVLTTGEATWNEDQLVPIFRNGHIEDTYWTFSYSPINNDDDKIHGVLSTCVETTSKVKNVVDFEEAQQLLSLFTESANLGTWDYNPITNKFTSNARTKDWFGLEPKDEISLDLATNVIKPTDRERVKKAIAAAIDYNTQEPYNIEYTIVNPLDKMERIVRAKGKPYFNEQNEPYRFTGTLEDITEAELNRKDLEASEERARLAAIAGNLGTFDHNLLTDITITSPRLHEIFNAPVDANRELLVANVHPDDKLIREEALREALRTGVLFYEVRILMDDSTHRWARVEGKVTYNEHAQPYRLLGTALDITDIKSLEQKREEYIAIASHELRNPLTSLKLSIDLLSRDIAEEQKTLLLSKSKSQVQRIITMTDDLLNVSKIASGQLDIRRGIVNLKELIEESVATFEGSGGRNPVQVSGHADLSIKADRFRIEQVLTNLVSNASKYSPENAPIIIHTSQAPNAVRIEVTDRGIGIDAEELNSVFKKFTRLESATSISGYGLGLYISEQIITKHGGEMGVESEKGKGSTFWFTLPF